MIRTNRVSRAVAALVAVGVLFVAGCSSSSKASSGSQATTTTAAPRTLQVLVTNDDGFDADGISAVVEGLRALPNVQVTVVAPATNQSGKGGAVTAGTLTATDGTTKAGYPAKAVDGTPADSVDWALDQHGISFTPDLVVSGNHAAANRGPVVDASGTVGAARAAVAHNIPAIAASQGPLAAPFDFPAGVQQVVTWFNANRDAIASGSITHATVFNLNIPSCPTGSVRGQVTVPPATSADGYAETPNCVSTATDPPDDIKAYLIGYAPISNLPAKPSA
jgi:5'-nucleotidase